MLPHLTTHSALRLLAVCGQVLLARPVLRRPRLLLAGLPRLLLVAAVDWRLRPRWLTCKGQDRHLLVATAAWNRHPWADHLCLEPPWAAPQQHQQHFTRSQQLEVPMQGVWPWAEALEQWAEAKRLNQWT